MLKIGDVVKIEIDSIALGGKGVGRYRDMVIFVPFTAEGDEIDVEITAAKKNYAEGRIAQIRQASSYRTEPRCSYYARCGGCHYQHIAYGHQLEIKKRQVRETFARIGRFADAPIKDAIPSISQFHYRGKAEYHIQRDGKTFKVGFMHQESNIITDIESCDIVDPSIDAIFRRYRKDPASAPQRIIHGDRIIIWSEDEPDIESTDRDKAYVSRKIKGKTLFVPYRGFFQANTSLTAALVDEVVSLCDLKGDETVLDVYCGSGLFSIFIAPLVSRVVGIEADTESINCANINMSREGLANASFFRGDAAFVLKHKFVEGKIHPHAVIIDPPRAGCSPKALESLLILHPAELIYISCDPATQARDIRFLVDNGFALKIVQPIDMFPQTKHIETVALLNWGR